MSGQVAGVQTTYAIFDEDTGSYAQDPATPDGTVLYLDSFDVNETQDYEPNEVLGSHTEGEPDPGVIDVSGSIKPKLAAESLGKLFKHMLGTVNTSGTNPYTHTITPGTLPTAFLIEKDNGSVISGSGRYEKHNGLRINGMTLDATGDKRPTITFDVMGAKVVPAASPLDATLTDNGYNTFSLMEQSIEEGGSASAVIKTLNMKFSRQLDGDTYTIGSAGVRGQPTEGVLQVRGELMALYKDMTLYNKALNNTASSIKLVLSRGTGDGSSGNEYLEIYLQNVKFARRGIPVPGPKGVLVKLGIHGYSSMQVVVKNAISTI